MVPCVIDTLNNASCRRRGAAFGVLFKGGAGSAVDSVIPARCWPAWRAAATPSRPRSRRWRACASSWVCARRRWPAWCALSHSPAHECLLGRALIFVSQHLRQDDSATFGRILHWHYLSTGIIVNPTLELGAGPQADAAAAAAHCRARHWLPRRSCRCANAAVPCMPNLLKRSACFQSKMLCLCDMHDSSIQDTY